MNAVQCSAVLLRRMCIPPMRTRGATPVTLPSFITCAAQATECEARPQVFQAKARAHVARHAAPAASTARATPHSTERVQASQQCSLPASAADKALEQQQQQQQTEQ